eukprot:UN02046
MFSSRMEILDLECDGTDHLDSIAINDFFKNKFLVPENLFKISY